MKTVLHNGKIYIERGVFCEALLIEDGYIRAAGTNDEVFDAATKPSAEMLDAQHAAEQGRQVSEDHDAEPVGGGRRRAPACQAGPSTRGPGRTSVGLCPGGAGCRMGDDDERLMI